MEKSESTPARQRITNKWQIATYIFIVLFMIMTAVTIVLAVKLIRISNEPITYEAMKSSEKTTAEILADDLEVSYGQYSTSGTGTKATVKNKGNATHSFTIHFEAISEDGSERIADDYLSAEKLAAGQSQKFSIFTKLNADEAAKMANAKIEIVDVVEY